MSVNDSDFVNDFINITIDEMINFYKDFNNNSEICILKLKTENELLNKEVNKIKKRIYQNLLQIDNHKNDLDNNIESIKRFELKDFTENDKIQIKCRMLKRDDLQKYL